MSRDRERIAKRIEKNPVVECNKIQQKFYPELFSWFGQVKDPRHSSYIDYSSKVMLGTVYYKGIAGISSMLGMTKNFNDDVVVKNLYHFMYRTFVHSEFFLLSAELLNYFSITNIQNGIIEI